MTGKPRFYGWVIVFISAVSLFFSGPGQTYTISIFIDHYIEDLNLSRSLVSGLYSAGTLLAGALLFLMGRAIDRHGQRLMTTIAAVMLGLTCMWNSYITGPVMLFIGFFLLRYWGQGSLMLLPNTLVPQWFVKRRGRASSFLGIGGFVGAFTFPVFCNWMIGSYGWSQAWQVISLVVCFGFAPLAYLLIRNSPESMGMRPDGQTFTNGISASEPQEDLEVHWTLKEAMHTKAFWLLLFCLMVPAMVNTGVVFHMVSIFGGNGLATGAAPLALAIIPFVSFPMGFVAGYLSDRVKNHFILICAFAGEVAVILFLLAVDSMAEVMIFAVLRGMLNGIESVIFQVIMPNYFGRKYIGGIKSVAMTAMVIGSAFGPLPFGIAYDLFGGYVQVIVSMAVVFSISVLAAMLSPKPHKSEYGKGACRMEVQQ